MATDLFTTLALISFLNLSSMFSGLGAVERRVLEADLIKLSVPIARTVSTGDSSELVVTGIFFGFRFAISLNCSSHLARQVFLEWEVITQSNR